MLATARFERAPDAPWSSAAGDAAAHILPGLRSWLAARHPIGCAVAVAVAPAPAHYGLEPAGRLGVPKRRRGDDEGYSPTW